MPRLSVTFGNASKRRKLLNKVRVRRWRAKQKTKAAGAGISVRTYEDLIAVLKVYRKGLGISQMELDEIAGFQGGYVGKLEVGYKEGGRGVGSMSLPTWLDSLGVCLQVVPKSAVR